MFNMDGIEHGMFQKKLNCVAVHEDIAGNSNDLGVKMGDYNLSWLKRMSDKRTHK